MNEVDRLKTDIEKLEKRIERLESALTWYATLPKEWKVMAGPSITYGDLHMLGENARKVLNEKL